MRIPYISKRFNAASQALIAQANVICREYQAAGYDLTLRQLYYQFVARGYIPNSQKEYKRLGSVINDARLAGHLDWDFLVDRTRNPESRSQWGHPRDIILASARQFHLDYWADQDVHVEVWVEKEALAGVVERTTHSFDVTSLACRGYMSQSEQWVAAQRFGKKLLQGKRVHVIHLGDHDPSGIDMSRDNEERLYTFLVHDMLRAKNQARGSLHSGDLYSALDPDNVHEGHGLFTFERIALTMDQVEEYDPPPNPAKSTDARFESYLRTYGDESWELDALDPSVLDNLITLAIERQCDLDRLMATQEREEAYRDRISELLDTHGDVLDRDVA